MSKSQFSGVPCAEGNRRKAEKANAIERKSRIWKNNATIDKLNIVFMLVNWDELDKYVGSDLLDQQ